MLAAALGGFDTAFWYTLTTRCGIVQAAFFGCQQCPCAANGTCSALDLATDPLCTRWGPRGTRQGWGSGVVCALKKRV